MNRYDAALLTLRGFALYAWFGALQMLSMCGSILALAKRTHDEDLAIATFAVPILLYIVLGVFLFIRSRELAHWLLPLSSTEEESPAPIHPLSAASVAFGVVGLATVMNAIPRIADHMLTMASMKDQQSANQYLAKQSWHLAAVAIQIIIGFLLFLKARGLATAWWRKQAPVSREEA